MSRTLFTMVFLVGVTVVMNEGVTNVSNNLILLIDCRFGSLLIVNWNLLSFRSRLG